MKMNNNLKNKILSTALAAGIAGYAMAPQNADATIVFSTFFSPNSFEFKLGNDSDKSINHIEIETPFTSLDDILYGIMPRHWGFDVFMRDTDNDGIATVVMEYFPTAYELGPNQSAILGGGVRDEFISKYGNLDDLVSQYGTDEYGGYVRGSFIPGLGEPISYGNLSMDYLGNGSDPAPVPEPATFYLLGSGLAGLAGLRRKKNKAN